jgi:hypothetical protein
MQPLIEVKVPTIQRTFSYSTERDILAYIGLYVGILCRHINESLCSYHIFLHKVGQFPA